MTETTQADFESHLEQHPDDWQFRLVYADWLVEHGEPIRANGQRWQVENKTYADFHTKRGRNFPITLWVQNVRGRFSGRELERPGRIIDKVMRPHKNQFEAEVALAYELYKQGIASTCIRT